MEPQIAVRLPRADQPDRYVTVRIGHINAMLSHYEARKLYRQLDIAIGPPTINRNKRFI